MDVTNAVDAAKTWFRATMKDEKIENLGLEEVEFNPVDRVWQITLGFSRPWNSVRDAVTTITGEALPKRTYRVITLQDHDAKVLAMKRREAAE